MTPDSDHQASGKRRCTPGELRRRPLKGTAVSITQPDPHEDPWVNLPFHYAKSTLQNLQVGGYVIDRAWMDPSNPRDCTFVLSDSQALVWDEDFGWRMGRYVSGRQGERTVL